MELMTVLAPHTSCLFELQFAGKTQHCQKHQKKNKEKYYRAPLTVVVYCSCITYICLENILKALSGRKHFCPSDPWPSSSLVWARAGKINCPTYDELWKTLTLSSRPHTDFFVWNEWSESEKAKWPLGEKFSLLFDINIFGWWQMRRRKYDCEIM